MNPPSFRSLQTQGLEPYLAGLSRIAPLDPAEAPLLFQSAAGGDAAARERVVLTHLPLVVRIACGYGGYGLPLADLISEGNLGLLRAAELFEPAFDIPFATYAGVWIKQRIHRAITAQAHVVRIPVWRSQRLRKLDRLHRELDQELGREAERSELADRLGLPEETLERLGADRVRIESIDAPEAPRDWEPHTAGDTPVETLSHRERIEEIIACLHGLDDTELHILSLKYGLTQEPPQSYRAMAGRFGKSREWVRRIGERAVARVAASFQTIGQLPRALVHARREHARQRLEALSKEENLNRTPPSLSVSPMVLMEVLEPYTRLCF